MAKATFQCHACGDNVTVVGRNRAEADRLAKYRTESESLCHDCWQKEREKQRAEESQKAAETAAVSGLPVLQGTEKQIVWAETIRSAILAAFPKVEESLEDWRADTVQDWMNERVKAKTAERQSRMPRIEAVIHAGMERIREADSAHWWIENRHHRIDSVRSMLFFLAGKRYDAFSGYDLDRMLEQAEAHMAGLSVKPAETAPPEIVAEAKAEAVVRPETPKTETVAEILIVGRELHITFPEKRDDFRELVKKQLGMTWGAGYWQRACGTMAGAIEDRLVESGHRLLAAGFPVRIYDEALRTRAISGEFEPEHTRWITRRTKGANAGWFCILWGREEDYYAPARKLPRSQYDKPYVVVPPEHFEEILDFAERYDFRLTQSGRDLAEQSRVNRDAALVAKVEPKPRAKGQRVEQANKPAPMPIPQSQEVDDALRDE